MATARQAEAQFRREAVLRIAERHPGWTYQDMADALARAVKPRISRQRVEAIVKRHMPDRNPAWRKVQPKRYTCSVCGVTFAGEKGYSGTTARRCPEHRNRRTAP